MKKIIKIVSDHIFAICLVSTILGEIVLFGLPIDRMGIVPHIITYSSCNLALIGFVFSLMLGLKGGYIYNLLIKNFPNATEKIYWRVFYVSCASSFSALISVAILIVKEWTQWAKYFCACILMFVFLYMILGTMSILGILIQLMIDEFPGQKDRGSI